MGGLLFRAAGGKRKKHKGGADKRGKTFEVHIHFLSVPTWPYGGGTKNKAHGTAGCAGAVLRL